MYPGVETACLRIEELLATPYGYRIPTFQRPYAWGGVEAEELVRDLLEALQRSEEAARLGQEGSGYFLGSMVLLVDRETTTDMASTTPRDVIDGQQRLVTLILLLAVLRDLVRAVAPDAAAEVLQLLAALRTGGKSQLEATPAMERALSRVLQPSDESTSGMSDAEGDEAASDVELHLRDVEQQLWNDLGDLAPERRASLLNFVRRECHVVVITTRAVDQAHHIFSVLNERGKPLSKSDILKADLLGQVAPEARPRCEAIWERLASGLRGDMDGLLTHIHTLRGRKREPIIASLRRTVLEQGGAEAFFEGDLTRFGEAALLLHGIGLPAGPDGERIEALAYYLDKIASRDWVPPALLWLSRNRNDPAATRAFLERLDGLVHAMRIIGYGGDKRASRLADLTDTIAAGHAYTTPGHPFELTRDEQRKLQQNLRRLHARSPLACKLILLRLDDAAAGRCQRLDPGKLTVEHVLPLHPPPESTWHQWFPNERERQRHAASLGNLVLVPRAMNARARTYDLVRKQHIYADRSTDEPLPLLTRDILTATRWGPEEISAREARLVAMADTLWPHRDTPARQAP